MGKAIKSILIFVLVGSLIFAAWRIWGVTGELDTLFGTIWDVIYGVLHAGSEVIIKAWNAVTSA